MRNLVRSSAGFVLVLLVSACTDRHPTEPTTADAPLFSTTADEMAGGSHEVIVTVRSEGVCRLTTFEGGGQLAEIHPELGFLIPGSNARFPGWKTLTSGFYANNPSGVTVGVMTATSHDMTFDRPVASVSFFYASDPDVVLRAFDSAESLVATVTGPGNLQPSGFTLWEPIGVSVAQNVITRVTIAGGTFQTGIDDFENCELLTPEELIDLLIGDVQNLVESGVLDGGSATALLATLDQARTAIARDRPNSANLLNAFIHQVEGLIAGGSLTAEQGRALITAAQSAIDLLSG